MSYFFSRNTILLAVVWCLTGSACIAQVPFVAEGQVFLALYDNNEIVEVINEPGTPSIEFNYISNGLPEPVNALAFRSSDRLLYAITFNGNKLLRIDANGAVEDLGPLPLSPSLSYLAGAISPDGSTFLVVGSDAMGVDLHFAKINLESPTFETETFPIVTEIHLLDIAYHPHTGQVYGYDQIKRMAVNFSPSNFAITEMTPFQAINDGRGVFFDAIGDLMAYGTTAFGAVDAILNLDEMTGAESNAGSGSIHQVADVAAASSSVKIDFEASPNITFPCAEIEFVYTIGNATGATVTDLDLVHPLPTGFTFLDVTSSQYGGTVITSNPGEVRIEGMNIGPGVKELVALIEVDDISAGDYESQATLFNLPDELGSSSKSDNPQSSKWEDPSPVTVNVFDLDSLYFNNFFCLGNGSFTIVADQFGNNIEWFNGSTSNSLTVTTSGIYTLEASSGCETVTVTYEVTGATCPYTIEVSSEPIPNETFPCSEITWRYIIDNDSGEEREGFSFADTLPEGFQFVGILENAFGGDILTDLPSRIIQIENMTMPMGFDTLDILVEVGDAVPGDYLTQATIANLPSPLGAKRDSDDPNTPFLDSTSIVVLGTLEDSVRIDTFICPGTEITLDAANLGKSFLWPNGQTASTFTVTQPGLVELAVFDGCDPSIVEYHVEAAPAIQVEVSPPAVFLQLGQTQAFTAQIINADDSLTFRWVDPLLTSLSCTDCLEPEAFPLESTVYTIHAANEYCKDSVNVLVEVDATRRIYAPNAFSPNGDGINDYFFLQSPDPGIIHSLAVYDRWGSPVFESGHTELNVELSGWNGQKENEKANIDTYVWRAEIEFIDGKREEFFGTVMLLR